MADSPIRTIHDSVVVHTTDGRQYLCDTAIIYDKYVILTKRGEAQVRWLNMSVVRSMVGTEFE